MRINALIKVKLGIYKKASHPIILAYHGVAPSLSNPLNSRHIDPVEFEKHLLFIKKHCNPIPLSQLSTTADIPGKRNVVLTFDDGYFNNLKYALPLLEKHKIPASIYITGLNQTKQIILWSDYHDLIAQFGPKSFKLRGDIYTHNGTDYKPFTTRNGSNVHDLLKKVDFDTKYEILNNIIPWEELKIKSDKSDYWTLLNDSEIKELNKLEIIEIGSHSFYHNNLSNIGKEQAFKEILDSKSYLDSLLDNQLYSIAYPDGSYTREIIDYSEQLGFEIQLAVEYNYPEDNTDVRIHSRVGVFEYETLSMQKINFLER